jgi:HPt (histidine-containing phosphotransfer) domain-containing protein
MSHVNMEIIQSLRDLAEPGEPDPLKECVDLYLGDSPECIQQLHSTFQNRDLASFKRAAHSLKGSSSNLGADDLAEICGRLEEMAKAGNIDGAESIIKAVESEFATVKRMLEEICAGT